jgi:hypothetical protein
MGRRVVAVVLGVLVAAALGGDGLPLDGRGAQPR